MEYEQTSPINEAMESSAFAEALALSCESLASRYGDTKLLKELRLTETGSPIEIGASVVALSRNAGSSCSRRGSIHALPIKRLLPFNRLRNGFLCRKDFPKGEK